MCQVYSIILQKSWGSSVLSKPVVTGYVHVVFFIFNKFARILKCAFSFCLKNKFCVWCCCCCVGFCGDTLKEQWSVIWQQVFFYLTLNNCVHKSYIIGLGCKMIFNTLSGMQLKRLQFFMFNRRKTRPKICFSYIGSSLGESNALFNRLLNWPPCLTLQSNNLLYNSHANYSAIRQTHMSN